MINHDNNLVRLWLLSSTESRFDWINWTRQLYIRVERERAEPRYCARLTTNDVETSSRCHGFIASPFGPYELRCYGTKNRWSSVSGNQQVIGSHAEWPSVIGHRRSQGPTKNAHKCYNISAMIVYVPSYIDVLRWRYLWIKRCVEARKRARTERGNTRGGAT